MIAIILAAGTGSRLMPLTREVPKPLLEIQGQTLLERMVKNCTSSGIEEFIIVLGHQKERVIEEVGSLRDKYGIKIDTVENQEYKSTNTSCSVYIGIRSVDDDVIIINGDNVVDRRIISGLVKIPKTALVVDNYKKLNEESFKLRIEDQKIKEIGKNIDIETSTGEFIGISKVSKLDLPHFKRILKKLITEDAQHYYDVAYKDLSQKSDIDYFYTEGLKWTEIDDQQDWEYAQILVKELEEC